MPDEITLDDFCAPLDEKEMACFKLAMEKAIDDIKTHQDRDRQAPRLNFIAAAEAAGFTTGQAEFLHNIRRRPDPGF